jgi:GDPmannose 4,6-dehydratase
MKAIIFGITGQDGSHLADLLLSKGYEVVGVCRRSSTNNTGRIKHILDNDKLNLSQGDITDVHSVINILKEHADVDEIYNLAAQSHVAVSFKQPGLTWDITGKGCLNILQSMIDLNLLKARFYQASSSEMYGKNYDTDREQHKFQDEETKFLPQSPYAIAKCAAHHMTRLFREAYDIHASSGILFNHEGPRRGETFVTRKITKWIGDFVKSGKSKDFPKLRLGNLEAFRDWGYAGDYVEAMWMMLQQDNPEDYVICTGETHTIREFLDVAFKHVEIDDWSEHVVQDPDFYRPAEVDYLRGRNQRAKERLGWKPKNSFEDLVKLMMDHDLEN